MKTCRACNSKNTMDFFRIKHPLLQTPILKKEKKKIYADMKEIISLQHTYCNNCGLIYSDISDFLSRKINRMYSDFYNYPSTLKFGIAHTESDSFLLDFGPLFSMAKTIIEIGCYDGSLLYRLRNKDKKVLGIEPSKRGAGIAREHGIDIINDFFPTKQPIGVKAEIVFSRHLIEHMDDPIKFINEQMKLVKQNGIVMFETPNPEWLIANSSDMAFHPQHIIFITKKFMDYVGVLLKIPFVYYKEFEHRVIYILSKHAIKGWLPLNSYEEELENLLRHFESKVMENRAAIKETIRRHIDSGHKIGIWGAGSFTGSMLVGVKEFSRARYIIDSDKEKSRMGFLHSSIPIVSSDVLINDPVDVLFIISQYSQEIVKRLGKICIGKKVKFIYKLFPKFDLAR